MLSFDLANQLSINASHRAASRDTAAAATSEGTGIDIGELEGTILIVVDAALASSGETMTFTVEHSYDNSTFTAVGADALVDPATAAADTFTVNTAAVAVFEVLALKRDRLRRYVRVLGTAAGNGTPAYVFASYVIGVKKYAS